MKLKLFLIFLLVSINIAAQDVANINTKPAARTFGNEYMPLNQDKLLIYDSPLGEAEMEIEEVDGNYMVTYSGSGIEYSQLLASNSSGIQLLKTENEIMFFGSTITYGTPVPRIPFPIREGETWSWEGTQINDEDTSMIKITGKMMGEEVLTTEAGTFKCIKIVQEIYDGKTTDVLTEWYAPNIGIVKNEAEIKGEGFTGMLIGLLGLEKIGFELIAIE